LGPRLSDIRHRKAYFVTIGFNPSKALEAVARARSEGADVVLVTRVDPIEPAERALRTVKEFSKSIGTEVKELMVDPKEVTEVFRISRTMKQYERVKVVIGGGLRIPQAYVLLATIDNWDRIEELKIFDHDTGDEVEIPKWLIPLTTSPERKGKIKTLKTLTTQPQTKEEIALKTGLSIQTTSKYLAFLTKAKLAKKVRPNKYKITPQGNKIKQITQETPT